MLGLLVESADYDIETDYYLLRLLDPSCNAEVTFASLD